jgi:monoamine oxidase
MGISSKLAKYITKEKKKIKEEAKDKPGFNPKNYKKAAERDLMQLEVQKMKKTELQEAAKGRGAKASAAKEEIERRAFNKEYGAAGEGGEAMSGPMQRELRKFYSGEKTYDQLDPKAMRFGEEELRKGGMVKAKMAVGGMPKKAPAKKPTPAKKPVAKKPAPKKK